MPKSIPESLTLVWPSEVFARQCRGLALKARLYVYPVVILSPIFYACETQTVYQRHAKKLYRFYLDCLYKLIKVEWQDRKPDIEMLKQTGTCVQCSGCLNTVW